MADRLIGGAERLFATEPELEPQAPWQEQMRVGRYDDQALNGRQVLEGYTTGAALTGGGGDRLGRLAPGYLADITEMAADPADTDPTRWSRRQRR